MLANIKILYFEILFKSKQKRKYKCGMFCNLSEEKKYKEITIKQITLNKEPTV